MNIYCDMDGVLVDFISGALEKVNEALINPPEKLKAEVEQTIAELGRNQVVAADLAKYSPTNVKAASNLMYQLLEDDEEFWANLPWMPEGQKLWNFISRYNPTILTSPMDKRGKLGSLRGKERWIKENLGLANIRGLIFEHKKYKHALSGEASVPNILIDDFMSKVGPWREHGGHGLHHTGNAAQTIEELKELLKDEPRTTA